jgi:predicted dehydrogenase
MRVRIYGAGSAGTHMSYACRQRGWSVEITDPDPQALRRLREELYPKRYGHWDPSIKLCSSPSEFSPSPDVSLIATPPDFHLELGIAELQSSAPPKVLVIEKPLCKPGDLKLKSFLEMASKGQAQVLTGFNLNLTPAVQKLGKIIESGELGTILRLEVEFRERADYILKAHWWLSDISKSYLGSSQRGGGACLEHSHALAMWLALSNFAKLGKVTQVSGQFVMEPEAGAFDLMSSLTLMTESGVPGTIQTDFVSTPPIKRALAIGDKGRALWLGNFTAGVDRVQVDFPEETRLFDFSKTRADDFVPQVAYIESLVKGTANLEANSLHMGVEVMSLIEAGYLSDREKRVILV